MSRQDKELQSIGDRLLSPSTILSPYASNELSPCAPALTKDLALSSIDAKSREMEGSHC